MSDKIINAINSYIDDGVPSFSEMVFYAQETDDDFKFLAGIAPQQTSEPDANWIKIVIPLSDLIALKQLDSSTRATAINLVITNPVDNTLGLSPDPKQEAIKKLYQVADELTGWHKQYVKDAIRAIRVM